MQTLLAEWRSHCLRCGEPIVYAPDSNWSKCPGPLGQRCGALYKRYICPECHDSGVVHYIGIHPDDNRPVLLVAKCYCDVRYPGQPEPAGTEHAESPDGVQSKRETKGEQPAKTHRPYIKIPGAAYEVRDVDWNYLHKEEWEEWFKGQPTALRLERSDWVCLIKYPQMYAEWKQRQIARLTVQSAKSQREFDIPESYFQEEQDDRQQDGVDGNVIGEGMRSGTGDEGGG